MYPILNEIDLAIQRLPEWIKDEWKLADATLTFQLMRPKVKKQPKGVALVRPCLEQDDEVLMYQVISPWVGRGASLTGAYSRPRTTLGTSA